MCWSLIYNKQREGNDRKPHLKAGLFIKRDWGEVKSSAVVRASWDFDEIHSATCASASRSTHSSGNAIVVRCARSRAKSTKDIWPYVSVRDEAVRRRRRGHTWANHIECLRTTSLWLHLGSERCWSCREGNGREITEHIDRHAKGNMS